MPTFSYTSGNISNLTAGGAANMADIQGPFTDLRSAINGNLDETNVPNLAAAFTTYKQLFRGAAVITSAATTGAYLLQVADASASNTATNAGRTYQHVLWLDPTDFNANVRTTKLRVRALAIANSAAPAITFTVGLYPIATVVTGTPGTGTFFTVGTVVTGSGAAIASPTTNTVTKVDGADFNFPAAGAYVLAVATTGAPAANSVTDIVGFLEMRQA